MYRYAHFTELPTFMYVIKRMKMFTLKYQEEKTKTLFKHSQAEEQSCAPRPMALTGDHELSVRVGRSPQAMLSHSQNSQKQGQTFIKALSLFNLLLC